MESLQKENFQNFSKLVSFKNKDLYLTSNDLVEGEDNLSEIYSKLSFNLKFYNGIGLSGIQIGIRKKAIIYATTTDTIEFVGNPEIIEFSDEKIKMYEGCLSFPNANVLIERPRAIRLKYVNKNFESVEKEFFDRDARIILHEIDHLSGLTMLDKISNLKKDLLIKKSEKFLTNPQFNIFFK